MLSLQRKPSFKGGKIYFPFWVWVDSKPARTLAVSTTFFEKIKINFFEKIKINNFKK